MPVAATEIDFEYDLAATFHNGLAVVEQDSMMGVIDTRGMLVVPFIYDWIEGFEQHVSRVRKSGKLGVISPFGDVLLAVAHDHVGTLNDSLMLVVDAAKCGYVNAGGQWVIKQDYDAPEGVSTWGDFHNGFAEVLRRRKARPDRPAWQVAVRSGVPGHRSRRRQADPGEEEGQMGLCRWHDGRGGTLQVRPRMGAEERLRARA